MMKRTISCVDILELYSEYLHELESMAENIYYNLPGGEIITEESSNELHELQTTLYAFAEELEEALRNKVQDADLSSTELEAHGLSQYAD